MALKSVKRVTLSLPRATVIRLEMTIPKSKRSKFVAQMIDEGIAKSTSDSFEDYCRFWDQMANESQKKVTKPVAELIREDRRSH